MSEFRFKQQLLDFIRDIYADPYRCSLLSHNGAIYSQLPHKQLADMLCIKQEYLDEKPNAKGWHQVKLLQ